MTDFDKLLASAPVNRAAALAAGGKGESWTPQKRFTETLSREPLPIAKVSPGAIDLTGERFGCLVVVGRLAGQAKDKKGSKGGCRWVCRCVCGNYTTYRARSLKAGKANCIECQYVEYLRDDLGRSR